MQRGCAYRVIVATGSAHRDRPDRRIVITGIAIVINQIAAW
jgi:hypothetical protein